MHIYVVIYIPSSNNVAQINWITSSILLKLQFFNEYTRYHMIIDFFISNYIKDNLNKCSSL